MSSRITGYLAKGDEMSGKIYVGNLSFDCTNEDLNQKFSEFGEVEEANAITDKFSGRGKGFGFVTYTDPESAKKAISEMNGQEWMGRTLRVDEARPPRENRRRF